MSAMQSAPKDSLPSISMALVGCGMWGRNIARNLGELNLLAGVCDTDSDNANSFAAAFNVPAYRLEEILADDAISALAITSPAQSHCQIACAALEAGKHVYIEKPMAMSLDEARQIETAALQAEKQVMIGHLIRYHPGFIALADQLEKGIIGEIYHIQANRLAMGRIRDTESVLLDLCPHDLSLILSIMKQQPAYLACHGISHITAGIADSVTTSMRFSSGITAQMQTSWIHPVKEHKFTVTGSKGSIVFDDTRPWHEKLCVYSDNITSDNGVFSIERAPAYYIELEEDEPLKCEMRAFATSCASSIPAPTGLAEGLAVQQTLETMMTHYIDISSAGRNG
ncbi:MAG: Gfo/Idh/MocA family protein [Candidatus Puniceispirillaceae bacterium]